MCHSHLWTILFASLGFSLYDPSKAPVSQPVNKKCKRVTKYCGKVCLYTDTIRYIFFFKLKIKLSNAKKKYISFTFIMSSPKKKKKKKQDMVTKEVKFY